MAFIRITACITVRCSISRSDPTTDEFRTVDDKGNRVKLPDEIQKKFAAKYYPGNSRVSHDQNYGLWYNARTRGVALGTFNIDLDAL
jgi:hypothetical protein